MNRLVFLFLLLSLSGYAQHPALLPLPRELTWTKPSFLLTGTIVLQTNHNEAKSIADSIALFVQQVSRAKVISAANPGKSTRKIEVVLEPDGAFHQRPEGYELRVAAQSVQLRAATLRGLFWGYQSLRQLYQPTPRPTLAGCLITDYPAFPIRGFMHDVGRSFIPIERLKQHIDQLSRYKINTFHWHLTEDLAWRLQSDSIPALTDSSVTLRSPGQFYTKQQARELVQFCQQRHVLLIPEIDMPGHSGAFKRATGHEMQSEPGKILVKKLLREVCSIFDVPYIHLGTDEVAFTDTTFVPEMVAVVRGCGKEVMGWLPGAKLDTSIIRQMWMGTVRPRPGQRVIDSRDLYFNHYSTQADLISLFQRTLCDTTTGSAYRLGAIGCVWNDRRPTDADQLELLSGFYPLMLTLAERSWRGGGSPLDKAGVVLVDADGFTDFEQRLLAHKHRNFQGLLFPYAGQRHQTWRILQPFSNGGNLSTAFPPEQGNLDFPAVDATGATIYLRHTWGPSMTRAYLDNPQPNHTAYAYTYVYSPKKQTVGAWIDFHNYGRSEKDASPPAGQWDYKSSCIWLNDQKITPPAWSNAGHHPASHEEPYQDEAYELRPPIPITLKKGWNKLLLKLPVSTFSTKQTRLVKWLYTCAFVQRKGTHYTEVPNLIFSPDRQLRTIRVSPEKEK
ncbi:family 20 glycosylhydrolase [Larkinella harenae]